MAGILASIDVEDLGTAKIREFRDALSDLLTVQQQAATGGANLAGGLSGGITALGAVNQAGRAAAEGLRAASDALADLSDQSRAIQQIQSSTADSIQQTGDALANLTAQAREAQQAQGAVTTTYRETGDALADLAVQSQQAQQVQGEAARSYQQTAAALDDMAAAAVAVNNNPPNVPPVGALQAYIDAIYEEIEAQKQSIQHTRDVSMALQVMQASLRDTGGLTKEAAAAFQELGERGLAEAARELGISFDELNQKLQAGVPLTEQEVAAFNQLSEAWRKANADVLGLASATEQLVQAQQEADDLARSTAAAWQILTDQLQAGATVSQLQKDALGEMADAAQGLADIAEEDRAAFQALFDQIQVGAQITPQQADEFERLNQVMQDAIGITREQSDALQDLIDSENEAAAATQQRLAAVQILERQLKEGAEVTQEQKDAVNALNTANKENADISQHARSIMDGLNNTLAVGQRVTAEQAAAVKVVAGAMRAANEETRSATTGWEAFNVKIAIVAAALATLTAGLFNFLQRSADIAARNEVLATSMEVVAKNAKLSTLEMQAQVERIKQLGITTSGATQAVLDFVQADLKLADASKIARAAQDLAVIANVNSTQAFERLTTAIQIQQPRLLRQFGIMTTLDQIYGQFASTVGKNADQLTTLEKRQAFINKILEEAAKVAGAYEAAMNDVGKMQASLDRLWEEAQNILGQQLLPVLRLIVDATTAMLKGFQALSPQVQRFIAIFLELAAAATTFAGLFAGARFLGVTKLFKDLGALVMSFKTEWLALGVAGSKAMEMVDHGANFAMGAMAKVRGEVGLLSRAWQTFVAVVSKNQVVFAILAIVTAVSLLAGAFTNAGESARQSGDQIREEYGKVLADINKVKNELDAVNKARDLVRDRAGLPNTEVNRELQARAAEQQDAAVKKLNKTLADYAHQLGITIDLSMKQEDAAKGVTAALEAQASVIGTKAATELAKVEEAISDVNAKLRDLQVQQRDTAASGAEAARVYDDTFNTFMAFGDQLDIQTSLWEDLYTIIKNSVIIVIIDLKNGLRQLYEFIVNLPAKLRAFITVLSDLQLPPWLAHILDDFGRLLDLLPNVRARIHATAQASEAMANAMDPERVKDQTAELNKQKSVLELTARELRNLVAEADRLGKSKELFTQAQADIVSQFNLVGTTKAALAAQEDVIKAGAQKLVAALTANQEEAKKQLQALGFTPDVEGLRAAASKLEELLGDYRDKRQKAIKQAEEDAQKHREAVKAFLGVDEDFGKQLRALNEALESASGDQELYNSVVQRGAKVLAEFNLLTDDQKEKYAQLGEVIRAGPTIALREWVAAMEEAQRAAAETLRVTEEAGREIIEGSQQDFFDRMVEMQRERVDVHRDVNEQIRELDEQLVDDTVEKFGSAVDQAIHQENRRFEAIERSIREEIRLRELALQREEEDIQARETAALRELALIHRRIQLQQVLDEAKLRSAVIDAQNDAAAERAAQNRLNAFLTSTAELNQNLDRIRQEQTAAIQQQANDERAVLNQRRQDAAQLTEAQLQALDRQKQGHLRNIALIKLAYNDLRNFTINVFTGVTQAALSGFARILEGTGSFKDALVGIWQSIKNAVFSFFDQIVQKWLADLIKMKTASAATNLLPGTSVAMGPVAAGPAGGGFGSGSALQGGLLGGAVGGMVGFGVGSSTGSFLGGALSGAASGAAVGAAVGGLPGALIGGAIGLVAGLFGAGKARREAEEARDAYISAAGGIQALTERAREAGVELTKLMRANDPGEVKRALEELDKALALRKAKEGLAETYSQLVTVRRQIQLVGGDIQKLYNAKTVEEFNAEQQRLNDLLEEQKQRLNGLQVAAQGIAIRLEGEFKTLQKEFAEIFDEGQIEDFFKAFADARARGFAGTAGDFARTEMDRDEFDIDEADITRINQLVQQAQELVNRLSLQVTATFAGILQETGDIVLAMNAVAPSLDRIIELQEKLGITVSDSLKPLLELRQVIKDNEDIAISLSGLTQTLLGLADAGRLNQELFSTFGQDAVALFNQLSERGVSTNNILLLMQPTLQALWEAQREFGFQTDEATQALLDQAEAAGIVGAQQMDINKKILDVLVIIAQTLGADIPDAYVAAGQAAANYGSRARGEMEQTGQAVDRNTGRIRDQADVWDTYRRQIVAVGDAAEGAFDGVGSGLDDINRRLRDTSGEFADMADAAEDAGRRAEDAMTGVAEGHSPTGIKQIVLRLQEATMLTEQLRDTFLGSAREMEGAAPTAVPEMLASSLQGVVRSGEQGAPQTTYVTVDGRTTFTVNGTKATAREEWERLKPEVVQAMNNNTGQIARSVGRAARRYSGNVGRNVRTPR